MDPKKALEIMEAEAERLGLPMLETMMHIKSCIAADADIDPELRHAYRIVFAGFERLLAPK